jgi:mono/diheme cytochrome c family protein
MKASPQLSREAPDPHEGPSRFPVAFLVFFATMAVVAGVYLVRHRGADSGFGGDQRSAQRPTSTEVTGESVFQKNCASCHQQNGLGVAKVFPPLAGSPWVVEDRDTPIRIVLFGISGPITVAGETYAGVMPTFKDILSDREIALAATHARSSFGNKASPITEEEVAKVRASLRGRTDAWSGGAALEEARKTKVLP